MVKMNLFRDKKQFSIIMCSLSLAVSLFLIINVVVYANNAKNILNHAYDYDIRLLNQTLLSDNEKQVFDSNFIEQIKSIDGVKDVRVLKSTTAVVPYQENVYGEYYKELYDSRYSPGNYEKDIEQYKKQPDFVSFTCRVVGIDEVEFKKINNLKISYVSQGAEDLKGNLKNFGNDNKIDESIFKAMLIKMGLSKSDFDTNIQDMSEGQKKKILIAKSISEQANIYIWDEPLNYIDILTRIQIEGTILNYKPTLVFVEHDEIFIEKVATKIINLERCKS